MFARAFAANKGRPCSNRSNAVDAVLFAYLRHVSLHPSLVPPDNAILIDLAVGGASLANAILAGGPWSARFLADIETRYRL